ncbi:hypothetical protein [Sphingobacterium multivorum]|uniref:hypothetical protein n=1 Tax=Sphingobacterium multivorum TaxID=28454 RepID=UPI0028AB8054|nr:hypothetical protein [Sphingobacterium multivorum]
MKKYMMVILFATAVVYKSGAQVIPNFKKAEEKKTKTATTTATSAKRTNSEFTNKSKKKTIKNGYVENYSWRPIHGADMTYTGYISNGLPNGKGKSIDGSLYIYDGNYINGQFVSGSTYTIANKIDKTYSKCLEGRFNENGYLEGEGTEYSQFNGLLTYKGEFVNGQFKGRGIYYANSLEVTHKELYQYRYEGTFDRVFIEGTIYFGDGCKYVGKLEGIIYSTNKGNNGIYYFTNSDSYQGEFSSQTLNGRGTYIWKSGTKYTGNFENNQINGEGELTTGTKMYKGLFKTLSDGRITLIEGGTGKQHTFSRQDGTAPYPLQKPKKYNLVY